MGKMKQAAEPLPELTAAETLAGDIRDQVLGYIKSLEHPWQLLKEEQQAQVIHRVTAIAGHLTREAVRQVAARGFPVLHARLVKAQLKDVMACQIDFSRQDPKRGELLDHIGMPVIVVLADAGQFMGESQEAKPEPDQSDFLDTKAA